MTDTRAPQPDEIKLALIFECQEVKDALDGHCASTHSDGGSQCRHCAQLRVILTEAIMAHLKPVPSQEERLIAFAIEFHRNIEGEYGCNGVTCPGVQRLIAHFRASVGIGKASYQPPAERGEARPQSLNDEIHEVMHQVDLTMHREENYYRPGVTRPTAEDWKERVRWLYAVLLKVVATSALAAPAAPPETKPHTTEAIALIEKWRGRASSLDEYPCGLSHAHGVRLALRKCAEELETLLAAPAAGEAQPEKQERQR